MSLAMGNPVSSISSLLQIVQAEMDQYLAKIASQQEELAITKHSVAELTAELTTAKNAVTVMKDHVEKCTAFWEDQATTLFLSCREFESSCQPLIDEKIKKQTERIDRLGRAIQRQQSHQQKQLENHQKCEELAATLVQQEMEFEDFRQSQIDAEEKARQAHVAKCKNVFNKFVGEMKEVLSEKLETSLRSIERHRPRRHVTNSKNTFDAQPNNQDKQQQQQQQQRLTSSKGLETESHMTPQMPGYLEHMSRLAGLDLPIPIPHTEKEAQLKEMLMRKERFEAFLSSGSENSVLFFPPTNRRPRHDEKNADDDDDVVPSKKRPCVRRSADMSEITERFMVTESVAPTCTTSHTNKDT